MKSAAIWLFALASFATGAVNLAWHEFESAHEPFQAFNLPSTHFWSGFTTAFAIVVAVVLIGASAGILFERTQRSSALLLAIVYVLFAIFWLPRLYWAPVMLGAHVPVFLGVLVGVGQQLILAAAAVLLYDPVRSTTLVRWVFGLSCLDFGLNHIENIKAALPYVPAYMPGGQPFWVVFTGVAFALAGIAICIAIADVLAARLLALMLFVFSALTLAPFLFQYTHDHIPWGANAYNLAAVAAALILSFHLQEVRDREVVRGYRSSVAPTR